MSFIETLYPLTKIPGLSRHYDDDAFDRLNSSISLVVFILLGVIVTTRQYLGEPISCWAPAQFSPEWVEYTNNICWISNTYYVPIHKTLPKEHEAREVVIPYYQWIPLFIILQGLFFHLPSVLWRAFNTHSGVHINKIVTIITSAEQGSPSIQEKTISFVVNNLDRSLRSQQEYRDGCFVHCKHRISKTCFLIYGKRYGNYLVTLYLFVKVLYIVNAVTQFFLLNRFLEADYTMYGVAVIRDLYTGRNWTAAKYFPRETMCDFDVRVMGHHVQKYTVQCALPINMLNEKVYIFIWFWLVLVGVGSTMSLLFWIWTMFRQNRKRYVKKYLQIMHKNFGTQDVMPSTQFCEEYLRQDGIFVLRIIAKNTHDLLVGEIVHALWKQYKMYHKHLNLVDHV